MRFETTEAVMGKLRVPGGGHSCGWAKLLCRTFPSGKLLVFPRNYLMKLGKSPINRPRKRKASYSSWNCFGIRLFDLNNVSICFLGRHRLFATTAQSVPCSAKRLRIRNNPSGPFLPFSFPYSFHFSDFPHSPSFFVKSISKMLIGYWLIDRSQLLIDCRSARFLHFGRGLYVQSQMSAHSFFAASVFGVFAQFSKHLSLLQLNLLTRWWNVSSAGRASEPCWKTEIKRETKKSERNLKWKNAQKEKNEHQEEAYRGHFWCDWGENTLPPEKWMNEEGWMGEGGRREMEGKQAATNGSEDNWRRSGRKRSWKW